MEAICRKISYILQKGSDAIHDPAFWSAVFQAANSVSQGDGTGAAVEGDRAWVGAFEAEGDTAAAMR
jgi:hypothetical protein